MIRRRYLGLAASLVPEALVSSGALAAAGESASSPRASDVAVPEPLPIVVDASREARAREWLGRIQHGSIDRSQLDPDLSRFFAPDSVADAARFAAAFGEPLAMHPIETRVTAEGVADLYRVRFASKTLTWVYKTGPRGINGLTLRHSTHDIVFEAILVSLEGY